MLLENPLYRYRDKLHILQTMWQHSFIRAKRLVCLGILFCCNAIKYDIHRHTQSNTLHTYQHQHTYWNICSQSQFDIVLFAFFFLFVFTCSVSSFTTFSLCQLTQAPHQFRRSIPLVVVFLAPPTFLMTNPDHFGTISVYFGLFIFFLLSSSSSCDFFSKVLFWSCCCCGRHCSRLTLLVGFWKAFECLYKASVANASKANQTKYLPTSTSLPHQSECILRSLPQTNVVPRYCCSCCCAFFSA